MYVYFQSVFRIQNFQHSESVHLFSMCIFSQISYSESAHALNYSENWPKIHIYSKMDDFWIRNILLIEYICVFLVNSQNNSMHARFQNMRSDWKYTYWKDGHFLNAEILNSENWLKIHIHSKSTWSFGPLSSFGPVMVIRTPIRKDPRADSRIRPTIRSVGCNVQLGPFEANLSGNCCQWLNWPLTWSIFFALGWADGQLLRPQRGHRDGGVR